MSPKALFDFMKKSEEKISSCLIRAHFSGFRASIEDTESNEEEAFSHVVDKMTFHKKREDPRLAMEISFSKKPRWPIQFFCPYKSSRPDRNYPALLQRTVDPVMLALMGIV